MEHLRELKKLARDLGFSVDVNTDEKMNDAKADIRFVLSFSDEEKSTLLRDCVAVLYTPAAEHFGIVPLECMAAARPVIACNSGGPLETVSDGQTGHLCPPDPRLWAEKMRHLLQPGIAATMGMAGADRVAAEFSHVASAAAWHAAVDRVQVRRTSRWLSRCLLASVATLLLALVACE